jgi:hypothetical protein
LTFKRQGFRERKKKLVIMEKERRKITTYFILKNGGNGMDYTQYLNAQVADLLLKNLHN